MTLVLEDKPTPEWLERNAGNALTHATLRSGREVHTIIQKRFCCRYDVYLEAVQPKNDHSAMIQRIAEAQRAFCLVHRLDRANDSHVSSGGDSKSLYAHLLRTMYAPMLHAVVWLAGELADGEYPDTIARRCYAMESTYAKALCDAEAAMKDFDKI